ncbi:DUF4365 domain-containing protein [Paenibacillus sp. A3]|uniref:DUF4365 domain-containing protein n=1 Tax=Paenibacillus sp. A3 TaxID=1337054 RepID=UPI0006D59995|nr:DUF4365 domain-containing protein [Paenibacillus sp. A3]
MPLTLNHKKEQLSIAYIRAVAAAAGFSCTKPDVDDDSVDIMISCSGTFGDNALMRSPRIEVQAKATAAELRPESESVKFSLPVKNYEDLRGITLVPRILVVMLVPEEVETWIEQNENHMMVRRCAYWISLQGRPETDNASAITIDIPRHQTFNVASVQSLMERVARREPL